MSDALIQTAVLMFGSGLTWQEVGETLGRDGSGVRRLALRRGFALPRRCLHGHAIPDGDRQCKTCARGYHRDRKRRQRRETPRMGQVANAEKTHCPAGHPLVPGNLRRGRPHRECATCHRERERKRRPAAVERMADVLRADPCAYCGRAGEHLDHIEPLTGGGDNDWTNLTAACGECNRRKSARPLLAFLIERVS